MLTEQSCREQEASITPLFRWERDRKKRTPHLGDSAGARGDLAPGARGPGRSPRDFSVPTTSKARQERGSSVWAVEAISRLILA